MGGGMWDAESLCASSGGHLASIHSEDGVAAVGALGANGAWIGLHDTYAEAGCTGQSNDHTEEGGFVWTDGSATDYLNWAGGEPNDWQDGSAHCDGTSTVGEDCSHVRGDDAWNDAGCGGNRAAICGMNDAWITMQAERAYDPLDCEFVKNTQSLAMQDAETACTVMGGHLAS